MMPVSLLQHTTNHPMASTQQTTPWRLHNKPPHGVYTTNHPMGSTQHSHPHTHLPSLGYKFTTLLLFPVRVSNTGNLTLALRKHCLLQGRVSGTTDFCRCVQEEPLSPMCPMNPCLLCYPVHVCILSLVSASPVYSRSVYPRDIYSCRIPATRSCASLSTCSVDTQTPHLSHLSPMVKLWSSSGKEQQTNCGGWWRVSLRERRSRILTNH